MENKSKKIYYALSLVNTIKATSKNNEALGRALLSFQDEFNNRKIDVPVDGDENINYAGYLIDMVLENNSIISEMSEDLSNKLALLAGELLAV